MKNEIEEALNWYDKNINLYKRFSKEMADLIEKIMNVRKIPFHSITYRVKERESYKNKCEKDKYKNPVEEIMDVSGIRIIVYTKQDVNEICNILKSQFMIDDKNSGNKADILDDDKVGYLSIHYLAEFDKNRIQLPEFEEYKDLKSEIQVRTLLQHAWAEIEHDKNYKFSGVLPRDIKRRFYLVAGVLEMMDSEFNNLSKEIDNYVKETEKKTLEGNFDIYIDTTSLSEYLILKFKKGELNASFRTEIVNNEIINELHKFGFNKIRDLNNEITKEILDLLLYEDNTYIGFLRDLMMYIDVDKYFKQAYNKGWKATTYSHVELLEKKGIAIKKYFEKYNIHIVDDLIIKPHEEEPSE